MSKDFSSDQGGIQSSSSTEFDPIESGTPKTGFSEAPKGEVAEFGAGPGVGNSRRGIH
jgi:hypothetical protein